MLDKFSVLDFFIGIIHNCFLNSFNDEVITYLKNKIISDTNNINDEKRHTEISTIDNFIDIMYFIHNPPLFLQINYIKYNHNNIDLMNKYVEDFLILLGND